MIKLTRTGVGVSTDHAYALQDTDGSGMLPIQAAVTTGSATFRVMGRVSPEAPWVEIIAAGTAGFLQAISWVPYIQLEVTVGAGSVSLWVGEK